MTCIAGLVDKGDVWIGADSWGGQCTGSVRKDTKIFRRGAFLIGYTTSFRMGQLLGHKLCPPKQVTDGDFAFMVTAFVDSVRTCLKDGGFAKCENEVEEGGSFLVGYRGGLYTIHSDYQVAVNRLPYAAAGCGESFALGSLHSTKGSPRSRILRALKTAGEFSAGVRGPFIIRKAPR